MDVSGKIFIVAVWLYINTKKVQRVAYFLIMNINKSKKEERILFLTLSVLNDSIYFFNNSQGIFAGKNERRFGFDYTVKRTIGAE